MKKLFEAIFCVLRAAEKPLGSYQVAKRTGCPPMDAGRALHALRSRGQVLALDVGGDQPLAEKFTLAHTS